MGEDWGPTVQQKQWLCHWACWSLGVQEKGRSLHLLGFGKGLLRYSWTMSRKMVSTFETSAAHRNWEQKFKILAHQHMQRGIQLSTGAQESSRELWNPRGANSVAQKEKCRFWGNGQKAVLSAKPMPLLIRNVRTRCVQSPKAPQVWWLNTLLRTAETRCAEIIPPSASPFPTVQHSL